MILHSVPNYRNNPKRKVGMIRYVFGVLHFDKMDVLCLIYLRIKKSFKKSKERIE